MRVFCLNDYDTSSWVLGPAGRPVVVPTPLSLCYQHAARRAQAGFSPYDGVTVGRPRVYVPHQLCYCNWLSAPWGPVWLRLRLGGGRGRRHVFKHAGSLAGAEVLVQQRKINLLFFGEMDPHQGIEPVQDPT